MAFNKDIISRERKSRGWTQRDITLALMREAVDITDVTVSNWERGNSIPRADQLEGLSKIFAMPIGKFFKPELQSIAGKLLAHRN